jgi:valyl-tRNA synthetase
LIVATWPQEGWIDEEAEVLLESLMAVVRGIRNARAEYNIQAGKRIPAVLVVGERADFFNQYKDVICNLAHLDEAQVTIAESVDEKPAQALTLVEGGVETYLPLGDVIDLDAECLRIELEKENVALRMAESEIRLRNSGFLDKAPEHVVQREREKRDSLREQWSKLKTRLQQLNEL